jgi:hypothetical protein
MAHRNFTGRKLLATCLAVLGCAVCAAPARAVDIDFDAHILEVDAYLNSTGSTVDIKGGDNDSNGLREEDQLGMLSAILSGGDPVDCIDAGVRATLNSAFTFNSSNVASELVVTISGVGTVNIIDEVASTSPALGTALRELLAGFLVISDSSTITFINTLADQLVANALKGTPQENQTVAVQNQITFLATDFRTHGNAPVETDYLGPAGDIDNDGENNLAEYTDGAVPKTREQWLQDNCITPSLRISKFEGGGLRISGLQEVFVAEAAGAAGPVTYQWRKGTDTSFTVVGSSSVFTIPFLTTASTGSYYCVLSDGVTTRQTPKASLSVTQVPIFFSQQPQGGTRFPGSSITFTASVQGGAGPGPYSYEWRKGNTVVGTNAPTLTLTNLKQSDAGDYRVRVTSNGGGDLITSSIARLTIRQLDFNLVQQPVGARKYIGDTYIFFVVITGGSGNFSYNWQKGGTSLGAPSLSQLNLGVLDENDAGSYTCVITDLSSPSSPVTTDPAVLQVTEPIAITTQPQGGQAQVGSLLELTVEAEGGYAPLRFQWLWEGVAILNQTTPVYSAIAQPQFEGAFRCRVTDDNGQELLSAPADIELVPAIVITEQPLGARVYTGTNRTLTAAATGGEPPLTYQWYKNNGSLGPAGEGASLPFPSLQISDSGDYFCRVTDSIGSERDTEPVTIQVADLPVITLQPVGKSLVEGEPLSLSTASFGGMPPVTYKWTRNSFSLLNGALPTYNVAAVIGTDAGTYVCQIEDNLGTRLTTNPVQVTVSSPLRITLQPSPATRAVGQGVTFAIDASGGVGIYSFDWRKDGQSLGVASNPSFTIPSVAESDEGTYSCRVTDGAGESVVTNEVALTIVPVLSAAVQPQGGSFFVGDSLTLEFDATGGLEPYFYQWYKGEQAIAGATSSTYQINSLKTSDTALYGCIIIDQLAAQLISNIVPVSVSPQVVITVNPAGGDKYTGTPQVFTVAATGGSGNFNYSWRKNGEALEDAPNGPVYTIPSLDPDDSGFYDCVVTESEGGAAASFPTLLRVRDLVSPVTQPADTIKVLGSSVSLNFTVEGGFEPVRFQWSKNDNTLNGATSSTLTLSPLKASDAGNYTCLAYDSLSSVVVSDVAVVVVAQPLTIISQPEGATKPLGGEYTFFIIATGGIGELSYTWLKDDAPLDVPSQPSLTLSELDAADTAIYSCVITDQGGTTVTSAEALLQVSDSPIVITQHPVGADRYVGEDWTFSVEAEGSKGELSYQWRLNTGTGAVDLPGETSSTLALDSIELADRGSYRCVVTDGFGGSVPSFSAFLNVAQRLTIFEPPDPVAAYIGSNVSFSLGLLGGLGTVSYQWFRGTTPVGTNSSSLQLNNISAVNAGFYTCEITADRDSIVTEPVELRTGLPLSIVSETQDVTRVAGEGFDFTVETAGGVGFKQYQWFRDGDPINITQSFRIDALTADDAGEYTIAVADEVSIVGGVPIYNLDIIAPDGEVEGPIHSADIDGDGAIGLEEMLRVIQFYNAGSYHCDAEKEDGFAPGENEFAPVDCVFHSSDFDPRDRAIGLSELLRALQIFRVGEYWYCPSQETEDSYCVELPKSEGEAGL